MNHVEAVAEPKQLFDRHLGRVAAIANRKLRCLPQGTVDRDDLISEGMCGLWRAAKKFDSEKRVPFARYADFVISGAMMDWLRTQHPGGRRGLQLDLARYHADRYREGFGDARDIPLGRAGVLVADKLLQEYMGGLSTAVALGWLVPDEESSWSSDTPNSPENNVEAVQTVHLLKKLIEQINPRQAAVLKGVIFDQLTGRELAEREGVTENHVWKLYAWACDAVKAKWAEKNRKTDPEFHKSFFAGKRKSK